MYVCSRLKSPFSFNYDDGFIVFVVKGCWLFYIKGKSIFSQNVHQESIQSFSCNSYWRTKTKNRDQSRHLERIDVPGRNSTIPLWMVRENTRTIQETFLESSYTNSPLTRVLTTFSFYFSSFCPSPPPPSFRHRFYKSFTKITLIKSPFVT